ncbi:MAG: hypothetical protein CL927_21125 [Deltaproteobacteria bacterium]|nr:hypothetical protein [Deltaproteobacteria bacterium]HCH64457.1 hypothetical protein [Deltaproteobacteria bacterium]
MTGFCVCFDRSAFAGRFHAWSVTTRAGARVARRDAGANAVLWWIVVVLEALRHRCAEGHGWRNCSHAHLSATRVVDCEHAIGR